MPTLVFAGLFFGLLAVSLLLWGLLLRLGLRWAHATEVTARRLVKATIVVGALQLALGVVLLLLDLTGSASLSFVACAQLIGITLLPWLVIRLAFRLSAGRAWLAWLPTLIAPAVMTAAGFLVVSPLLCEAFVVSSNAMAPTLLGDHCRGTCVECGQPAYASPVPPRGSTPEEALMICENFHVTAPPDRGGQVYRGDHLMAAKFIAPRRWDVVVFRYPEDPSVVYVKRLVGMPGEVITIEDGRVLANGKPLTPPDSLRGIEYRSQMPSPFAEPWGSAERPARLGADEYFVLGDFSARSMDSRWWGAGAPGNHPYAVPESHLVGVVTHIYWPPARWRAFR